MKLGRKDHRQAAKFEEFIRVNLKRLKALGNFRNSYIMYHRTILDPETRPALLDLGLKILEEAYAFTGQKLPDWIKLRLPENQLEESIEDNRVIVEKSIREIH